jgi:type I restriction enzyme S subunit
MTRLTLGELIELQRGYDLPEPNRRPGVVPVIGSAGVTGYHDTARVNGPGVTLGRSGASFGKVTYVREDYWPHNAALFVKDFKGNDPLFIRYLLEATDFSSLNSGSAQQSLNRNYVYGVITQSVSHAEQRRIASILSAYDDLIENCQRRIRILEDMARGLYREWFVHFRFPGADALPRVDSPLGPMPQGWALRTLADVASINRSQISTRTAPDELHYIDIASVSPGRIDTVTTYRFDDAPGRARRVIAHGDVLWSCVRPNRRSHAMVMHPAPDTIASTGFAVLTPKSVPSSYLYHAVTTDEFVAYLTNSATGAAYPAVTAETFAKAVVVLPEAALLERFAALTTPMAEQRHTLQSKIANLRRTRDLLLPRLLSGQITPSIAEDSVPA